MVIAERSSVEVVDNANQSVDDVIPSKPNFLPNGKFAPGNRIGYGNPAGRGYQKISTRMAILANEYSREEINEIFNNVDEFAKRTVADRVALKRVVAADDGDRSDAEFLMDRLEGKATNKTELTGKDGGPVAVATADVTNLLLEAADGTEDE
jgi:hypothetical protein